MRIDNLIAPADWCTTAVGDCCLIHNHLRLPLSQDERKLMQGDFPYYGPTGILDHIDHYRIDAEYALIGEDGDHFLKFDNRDMTLLVSGQFNVNNHAHLVMGTDACTTSWFYYFFKHADLTPYITRQGAGRFKLNKAALLKLPMILPPLPEQRAIAAILSTWDDAIALTSRLIDALKRRKQALMQRLLTGQTRFPEFAGEEWEETELNSLLTESRIRGNDGVTARKVTVKLYGKGVVPKVETRLGSENTQYYMRSAGQFIYSKLDFLNGAFGIIPPALDGYESTLDLPAFDFSPDIVPSFLLAFASRETFYSGFLGQAKGGRKARRIPVEEFLETRINLPSYKEQQRIADVLGDLVLQIDLYEDYFEGIQTQKRALMQRLLTGQVRVSTKEG